MTEYWILEESDYKSANKDRDRVFGVFDNTVDVTTAIFNIFLKDKYIRKTLGVSEIDVSLIRIITQGVCDKAIKITATYNNNFDYEVTATLYELNKYKNIV